MRRPRGNLVDAVASWLDGTEDILRKLGAIGQPVPVPPGADPQTQLLARFGRTPPPFPFEKSRLAWIPGSQEA